MDTPEFLVWAIHYACPVRGSQDGSDPERTERQLRAARAVSDARRDGRVLEGLCLDPPLGFRIADALAVYGGERVVEQACGNCPANALPESNPSSLAGCYGMLPLPADERIVHCELERVLIEPGLGEQAAKLFLPTQPKWYGLWLRSPLAGEALKVLSQAFAAMAIDEEPTRSALQELVGGMHRAAQAGLALQAELFPRGTVADGWWHLTPHCQVCRASWLANTGQCAACGRLGRPTADKKRRARGRRPYFPLDRLLGAEQAAAILARFTAFQGRPQSPDPAQGPPH